MDLFEPHFVSSVVDEIGAKSSMLIMLAKSEECGLLADGHARRD
jgi:hypothetical protein